MDLYKWVDTELHKTGWARERVDTRASPGVCGYLNAGLLVPPPVLPFQKGSEVVLCDGFSARGPPLSAADSMEFRAGWIWVRMLHSHYWPRDLGRVTLPRSWRACLAVTTRPMAVVAVISLRVWGVWLSALLWCAHLCECVCACVGMRKHVPFHACAHARVKLSGWLLV